MTSSPNNIVRIDRLFIKHAIVYACIGAFASMTDSLLYIAFTRKFGIWYLIANFMSVNIAMTLSFLLNSFLNFKQTKNLLRRAIFFYGICYFGLMISMGILYVGISLLGFSDIYVKLFSVLFTGCIQFTFNKLVTFKKKFNRTSL